MKIRFLGTNGWFDSATGNSICTLLEAGDRYVVLDAGNGLHKLGGLVKNRPVDLFLSHLHLDHIEGLHTIVKFRLEKLRIFGIEGTESALRAIIRRPYTIPLGEGPYPVEVHELPQAASEVPYLEAFEPLVHAGPCTGFRFRLDGRTIAYCTDTGPCENLIRLGRGADLLITECSELTGHRNEGWPHLGPEDALDALHRSGAKKLVLTHFNAHRYATIQSREAVQDAFPELIVAYDDMVLEV